MEIFLLDILVLRIELERTFAHLLSKLLSSPQVGVGIDKLHLIRFVAQEVPFEIPGGLRGGLKFQEQKTSSMTQRSSAIFLRG